jgi:DNA (cytosine-5)-methyltransferase 1
MKNATPAESHNAPAASQFKSLVLSLFPGAGLLDRGFEQAGFCVVRGPDTLLGHSIEGFTAPAGHFSGVIGGPPCQDFSRARRRPPTGHGQRMLNEFARVVTQTQPDWWLMENVPGVPDIHVSDYVTQRFNLFAFEFGCRQRRNRSFQFGSRDGLPLVLSRGTQSQFKKLSPAVLAHDGRRNFSDLCELQGLPRGFTLPGLSRTAKYRAVGNGVPVPMAKAVAEAIRDRRVTDQRLCACGCGRPLTGPNRQKAATAACRKRLERARNTPLSELADPLPNASQRATWREISCLDESLGPFRPETAQNQINHQTFPLWSIQDGHRLKTENGINLLSAKLNQSAPFKHCDPFVAIKHVVKPTPQLDTRIVGRKEDAPSKSGNGCEV